MKLRKTMAAFAATLAIFTVVGCGGPKTVSNQQTTLNLTYGDRSGSYTGEVNEQNVPNGKGKFETKNSVGEVWVYEGAFKDGHFVGKGKTVWKESKQSEEGTYSNDRLNGQGKRTVFVQGQPKTQEGNFVAGFPMKAETADINTEVSYADWKYRVTKVETRKSAGNRQAAGRYLVLTMNAQNNGQETRQPGASNFYMLIDSISGKFYQMDDNAMMAMRLSGNDYSSSWYLTEVNPGNTATGYLIIFDIPENLDVNNLLLLPRVNNGDATPIKLKL